MAEKICTICKKHSSINTVLVKLRGKYNPTTKRRKYPNLQWVRLRSVDGKPGKRVLACAKCIKRTAKI
jgi:ribosomal protein L28